MAGDGTIRSVAKPEGFGLHLTGDFNGYTGDFVADRGNLWVGRSTSGFTEPVSLNPSSTIHIFPDSNVAFFTGDSVIENDLVLHNANGTRVHAGAFQLEGNGTLTLAGTVDVGDVGSTFADSLIVTGTLTGRNLSQRFGGLNVHSPQDQLEGTLRVANRGSVRLDNDGSLLALDEIVLESGGQLVVERFIGGPQNRVSDSTLIRSRGGRIRNAGSEKLGRLVLEQGQTELLSQAALVIEELERQPGTILSFSLFAGPGGVSFENAPALDNGMIGAWAVTGDGFATLDGNGAFQTLGPTSSNLNTAGPNDHVRFRGDVSLNSDTVVDSLHQEFTGSPITLDLNGNRLRVRSGGIFQSAPIENGTLTAGDLGEDAELVLYNANSISADIVDNSGGGSVGLVLASSVRLSGNNSYTGGTWIHGEGRAESNDFELTIEDIAAIPANDRVHIDGGRYRLSLPGGVVKLSELHLRGGGSVNGFLAPIDAEAYYLQHGLVNAPFTGDGPILKDTPQHVSFENVESPDYTGQVTVRDGSLSLRRDTLPQATFHLEGGSLEFSGGNIPNEIRLQGGALDGGNLTGDVFVDADSTLIGEGNSTVIRGKLTGNADLTIDGRVDDFFDGFVGIFGDASEFHGDFEVRSGPLRIGSPAQLGDGLINVHEGGRLILASDRETSPPTELDNTVHLYGGTLISAPPRRDFRGIASPSIATGDVHVHADAFIGSTWPGNVAGEFVPGLTFAGRLILDDDVSVYGLSDSRADFFSGEFPLVEISGELLVGENTTWNMATASLLISGSISPTAANSSIDFQGVPSSLVLRDTNILTDQEKSLQITLNGRATQLSLTGDDALLSGNGSLFADIDLGQGAAVSPGNSAGEVTVVGDMTMGEGAEYHWEIASATGTPGDAWDLLLVEGDLSFEATPENPWVLRISDLPGFTPGSALPWLIASADSIMGFDPAAVEFDLIDLEDAWPGIAPEQFTVFAENGDLFLLAVPEPSTLLFAAIAALAITAGRGVR